MSSQSIDFSAQQSQESHVCQARRSGDWIIFSCEKCPGYERRLNWKTGEMKVKGDVEDVLHQGVYLPDGATLSGFGSS